MGDKTNKIISNTGWQIGQQIYSMLLSLVIGALTARYLGPSNYGLIGYGASLVVLFNSISTLGMSSIVLQRLLKEPDRAGEIVGTTMLMRVLASFFSILLITLLVTILEPDNKDLRVATLLQAIALIFNSYEMMSCWFQSRLELKYVSIATILAATAVGLWRILLLVKGSGVAFFAASACVQSLVCAFVISAFFFGRSKLKLGASIQLCKEILGKSYHFIISGVAVTLYTQIDKIMIGKMLGEASVGIYTAAVTIATLWEFVPMAIINSSNTVIFGHKEAGRTRLYEESLKLLFAGLTVMGIAVGIVFMVFGPLAVKIMYGEAYRASVAPLMIIAWSSVFAVLGCAEESWTIAENKNKYAKYYVYISCAVNVVLNWLLIPKLGIIGAAWATLISQITAVFLGPTLFKSTRGFVGIYLQSFSMLPKLKNELLAFLGKYFKH